MAFKMRGFSPFAQKEEKKYPKSYTKEDIEFLKKQKEDVVRREDLDEMGKKIFDCNKNPNTKWNNKTKKCEPKQK